MTWIKDQYGTYVNIDNFDFIFYRIYSHSILGEKVLFKFCIKNFHDDKEYVLGCKSYSEVENGDEYIKCFLKGCFIDLQTFENAVKNYFNYKHKKYISNHELNIELPYVKEYL